jgi:asparaginyl-tRNA synthetase
MEENKINQRSYPRVWVHELAKWTADPSKTIELRGWVYNSRSSGKVRFIELRDGTGIVSCIFVKGECSEEAFTKIDQLGQETSLVIRGTVRKHPKKENIFEIGAQDVEVLGLAKDYPITPKEHGVEFLMDHRHLWLRSKRQVAIQRVRHELIQAIRDFFDGRGFTLTDAPVLTPNACEGTTQLFETTYFDEKMFLSQSGQLYMEATAAALGKVYCFGPTFRAEKSKTRRHLIEFWMVEPEVAFADMYDNMELGEQFVEYIVQRVLNNRAEELRVLERNTLALGKVIAPFPKIHYREACDLILKENPEFKVGDDFGAPDETIISSKFEKPVFVHHFPSAVKAFYMKEDPEDRGYAMGSDLLAPEGYGEIIGGGQREDNLEILLKKIHEHGLNPKVFSWYLDLRRYGSFPHSGFGLGIERTLAWICGLTHVRETIPFPRLYGRNHP